MFESASSGALTNQAQNNINNNNGSNNGGGSSSGNNDGDKNTTTGPLTVEYPQFQAICRTMFPFIGKISSYLFVCIYSLIFPYAYA